MRAKEHKIPLLFLVLIADLYWKARGIFVAKMNIDVTPTSSTDIRSTSTKYYRNEVEPRKISLVERCTAVDIDTLEKDTTSST